MQNSSGLGIKVTVLSKCANGDYLGGLTHNSRVVLHICLGDYVVLAKILCKNVSLIYNLGISQALKDELLRDTRTIRTILEKSEKEVLK